MQNKFKNKYRIPSARLQNWDYGNNASYFITICTKNKEHYFGEIVEIISTAPPLKTQCIASDEPNVETQNIASDEPSVETQNIASDEPSVETQNIASDEPSVETQNIASLPPPQSSLPEPEMQLSPIGQAAYDCWNEIPKHFPFVKLGEYVVMPNHVHGIIVIDKADLSDTNVETQYFASLPPPQLKNKFGPQSQNLGSIVRGFKIGITKFATANAIDFEWQARYHDHVIRNEDSYERIRNYIINNPKNWKGDKFYS